MDRIARHGRSRGLEIFTIHARRHRDASCLHIGNTFHCNRLCPTRKNRESVSCRWRRFEPQVFVADAHGAAACRALVCASLAQAAQFSVDAVKAAYLFRFASVRRVARRCLPTRPSSSRSAVPKTWPCISNDCCRACRSTVSAPRFAGSLARRSSRAYTFSMSARTPSRARARCARAAVERPILIVTDDERGLDGGGVINFIEVNRNLRFEISLNAADRSGLKINSALAVGGRARRAPAAGRAQLHRWLSTPTATQQLSQQDGQRRSDQREMRGLSPRIIIAAALCWPLRRCMRNCWPMPAIR